MGSLPHGQETRNIKKTVTSPLSAEKKFYPDYLSEIVVSFLIAFELLLLVAMLFPPPLGRQIDFTKLFQPRPEWYFLWLFELVGYFPGSYAVVGTVVLPVIGLVLLMLFPFIDNGRNGRIAVTVIGIILLTAFVALTVINMLRE